MSELVRVAAVVAGQAVGPLGGQTWPPEDVFAGSSALAQAIASRHEWLWLIGPGLTPDHEALARLVEGVAPDGDPTGSLVAGLVLDQVGAAAADQLPGPRYSDDAAVIRLVRQRLLPIRHCLFANCLIKRTCFDVHGLPDFAGLGPYAPTAWTAIVLRQLPGYFAPLSVVRISPDVRPVSRRDLLATTRYAIRMTRCGAWTRGESARALSRLAANLVEPAGS